MCNPGGLPVAWISRGWGLLHGHQWGLSHGRGQPVSRLTVSRSPARRIGDEQRAAREPGALRIAGVAAGRAASIGSHVLSGSIGRNGNRRETRSSGFAMRCRRGSGMVRSLRASPLSHRGPSDQEGPVTPVVRGRARRPYANRDQGSCPCCGVPPPMPAVCTGSVTAVWHGWPTRAQDFSSSRAPATLAPRRGRVRLAASPGLVRYRIPAGALSTRGRSSARLRLSGPPGGPPPRPRLLDRSSKGVAKPYQCVERSYGHCCARMERCGGRGCRGVVVTTSITASSRR
jgi:hypothetical protein